VELAQMKPVIIESSGSNADLSSSVWISGAKAFIARKSSARCRGLAEQAAYCFENRHSQNTFHRLSPAIARIPNLLIETSPNMK
jgi:hypothetical protein